jgi:hypothetical protein
MKKFQNINKNNLYIGKHMFLGIYSTDWSTYELEVKGTIQNIKNGYIGTLHIGDQENEQYLENLKNVLLDNYQNFAGRNVGIIDIDGYSCACVVDEVLSLSILTLISQYVYPFDEKQRYPMQMIETKTTWKY